MNNSTITFLIVICIGFTACNSSKKIGSARSNENIVNANEKTRNDPNTSIDSVEAADNQSYSTSSSYNGSTGAMNNLQANKNLDNSNYNDENMFVKLEMTEEQIDRFQSAMTDFSEKKRNTPSGEIMGSVESERKRQLQRILSVRQFKIYEEWEQNEN